MVTRSEKLHRKLSENSYVWKFGDEKFWENSMKALNILLFQPDLFLCCFFWYPVICLCQQAAIKLFPGRVFVHSTQAFLRPHLECPEIVAFRMCISCVSEASHVNFLVEIRNVYLRVRHHVLFTINWSTLP